MVDKDEPRDGNNLENDTKYENILKLYENPNNKDDPNEALKCLSLCLTYKAFNYTNVFFGSVFKYCSS